MIEELKKMYQEINLPRSPLRNKKQRTLAISQQYLPKDKKKSYLQIDPSIVTASQIKLE